MIRAAREPDMDVILDFCAEHAAYEQADYEPAGKGERLEKALFGSDPQLHCLIAEVEGEPVGYATFLVQYSTWDAERYLYMDCLYLREAARGKGLGGEMMEALAKEGRKLGCREIQWQTPDFNAGAIRFYKRLGAVSKAKERFFLSLH